MRPERNEAYTVDSTRVSRQAFARDLDDVPGLDASTALTQELPKFAELQTDAFHSFYLGAPAIKDAVDVDGSVEPHRNVIEALLGLEEFQKLKGLTTRQRLQATIACRHLPEFLDALPDGLKKKLAGQQSEDTKLEELHSQLEFLRRKWRHAEDDERPDIEAEGQEAATEAEGQEERAEVAANELAEEMGEQESAVRVALRKMCDDAAAEIEAYNEMALALGCGTEGPSPVGMDAGQQMALAQRLMHDEELKRFARIAGRIQRIGDRVQRSKVHDSGGEIVDVETGRDLSNLVPSEYINFAHPSLEMEFYRRWLDGQLLTWMKEDKEPEGEGPIVVCVDESISMEGLPILWAKAVALRLYNEACRRKQPCALIRFSTTTEVHRMNGDATDHPQLLEFLSSYIYGGTDYGIALAAATDQFAEADLKRADFVFISDGQFDITGIEAQVAEFREMLTRLDAKSLGVYIGTDPSGTGRDTFGPLCHHCWSVNLTDSIEDDTPLLTEMFQEVLR